MQPVATTFVNPLDPNYTDDVRPMPYDPAKAKALLAEAGWTPGADGVCRNAAGQRLSLDFGTTAGNRLRELTQQVLQSQWKASCIEVAIKNEPARTLFGETVKNRELHRAWRCTPGAAPSREPRRGDVGTAVRFPTAANNWGGSNARASAIRRWMPISSAPRRELDPGQAQGDLGRRCSNLRRGSCRCCRCSSAPRRMCAEMAEGLRADRPQRYELRCGPRTGAPSDVRAMSAALAPARQVATRPHAACSRCATSGSRFPPRAGGRVVAGIGTTLARAARSASSARAAAASR